MPGSVCVVLFCAGAALVLCPLQNLILPALVQAAKSLGQTLRAFQPTIRELTQVSAELKSTLESEIGINEIKEELRRPVTSVSRALDETISGTGTAGAANSAPVQVRIPAIVLVQLRACVVVQRGRAARSYAALAVPQP